LIDKVYVVNDVVDIGGTYGIVEIITLCNIQVRTFDGNIITVPNSQVANNKVINMTSGKSRLLATTSVNLGFKQNSDNVKKILGESVRDVEGVYVDEKSSNKLSAE
jgi:small conductance mechanosensitive channel